ncbi:50S ribosomal protein L24 [bacterium]|nr:MAG: 50S ribosomal protein L24 [bacterium]
MRKLKKGDTVQIISGKDKGKKGKILKTFLATNKALVEGLNLAKKHKRKTRDDQKGGVIQIEAPIGISNLSFFCKHCGSPTRLGFTILKDSSKARFCKACKEVV